MGAVRALALAALLLIPAPVSAQSVSNWRPYISEASQRFGVPVAWIERVMRAESGGRTSLDGRPITSHAGAMGLMQLMPATWSEMRIAVCLGGDPHDPHDNIIAGTAYLRMMHGRAKRGQIGDASSSSSAPMSRRAIRPVTKSPPTTWLQLRRLFATCETSLSGCR